MHFVIHERGCCEDFLIIKVMYIWSKNLQVIGVRLNNCPTLMHLVVGGFQRL